MSRGFYVSKISASSAILAVCTIGLAMAARTISATHPSAQSGAALFGATDSNKSRETRPHQIETGSVADAVEAASKAVFSLRVKYRVAAGGMSEIPSSASSQSITPRCLHGSAKSTISTATSFREGQPHRHCQLPVLLTEFESHVQRACFSRILSLGCPRCIHCSLLR